MHIPDAMLQGGICPITTIVSTLGLVTAGYSAINLKDKPSAKRFGAVSALIFAGQMMNFPISGGTSGHLLGGLLAVSLLGIPFGILSVALVLAVQCLVFADGGISVLGANIFNMALIGAGLGGFLRNRFMHNQSVKSASGVISLGFIAWLSVIAAAFVCSLELAISGTVSFSKVIGSMVGTHALIGIGEAVITVAACFAFSTEEMTSVNKKSVIAPITTAGVIALLLSSFASSCPDGLEWVAAKYQFLHESAPYFVSPLSDYAVPMFTNEAVTTGLAGLIGVAITFFAAWIIGELFTRLTKVKAI